MKPSNKGKGFGIFGFLGSLGSLGLLGILGFLGWTVLGAPPRLWAQEIMASAPAQLSATSDSSIPAPGPGPEEMAASQKPSYYAEIGGFYNGLNNSYGSWRGLDLKFGYTGSDRFSPYLTFSSQTRTGGSQQNYGAYSYVTLTKTIWSVVGMSGAPAKDAILYPKVRLDASVYIGVPQIPGLNVSVGYTDFFMEDGGGGRIISTGGIYYLRKLIVSGSVNFNRNRPGGLNSQSVQAGFQYGSQGDYWFGAGVAGGKIAYQLVSLVPFDVRFDTVGLNAFYTRWITRNVGLVWRYDFQNQFEAFTRHGVSASAFFEF